MPSLDWKSHTTLESSQDSTDDSLMAHVDGMDETGGTSLDSSQTHTDEMAHRWLADDRWSCSLENLPQMPKTPLNLTLATVILPNYLRMAHIHTLHNTSVEYDVL